MVETKQVKIYINYGNIYEDSQLRIELLNFDQFLESLNAYKGIIPLPHFQKTINFNVYVDEKKYGAHTVFDSHHGLSSTVEEECPYRVDICDWKLEGSSSNPYVEFAIIKK